MKKFFRLHGYLDNMKAKIDAFSLKRLEDIQWKYVNHVRGIIEEELCWDEFERLLNKKYLYEIYYDGRVKEFYELGMGSMIYNEYTSIFLDFFGYAPYLKEEKENIQRFINGFLVAFKDQTELDEPWSLWEAVIKLKHCYEQSNHKYGSKSDQKGNEKTKGKWPK